MNGLHRWLCRSARWAAVVERELLPWVLEGVDLGGHALEVGPGPGVTTDRLRRRTGALTCVEIDRPLAEALARRTAGGNVRVVCGDATALAFPDGTFDAAVSFTMLHHVPSAAMQDRLLAEVARVLRPGALFAGTDSIVGPLLRLLHVGDTLVPVDPGTFSARLAAAGFTDVDIAVKRHAFRFRARRQGSSLGSGREM